MNVNYTTYIDESGNTGCDLTNKKQKIFVLASVSIPNSYQKNMEQSIKEIFDSGKEKEEKELKAMSWIKEKNRRSLLQKIIEDMIQANCFFSIDIIEKKYMITSKISQNFFDAEYNKNKDFSWLMPPKCIEVSNHLYKYLEDDDIDNIWRVWRDPKKEDLKNSVQRVKNKVKNPEMKEFLDNFDYERFFKEELVDDDEKSPELKANVQHSPNFTSFVTLGNLIVQRCKKAQSSTNIIFDHYDLVDKAYSYIIGLFKEKKIDEFSSLGLACWDSYIADFQAKNSKSTPLLQTADIIATSVMKTIERVFCDGKTANEYENFIIELIKKNRDSVHIMASNEISTKLGY